MADHGPDYADSEYMHNYMPEFSIQELDCAEDIIDTSK